MTKQTLTVTFPDGTVGKRTTERNYTHVVAVAYDTDKKWRAVHWCGSLALAEKQKTTSAVILEVNNAAAAVSDAQVEFDLTPYYEVGKRTTNETYTLYGDDNKVVGVNSPDHASITKQLQSWELVDKLSCLEFYRRTENTTVSDAQVEDSTSTNWRDDLVQRASRVPRHNRDGHEQAIIELQSELESLRTENARLRDLLAEIQSWAGSKYDAELIINRIGKLANRALGGQS